MRMSEQGDEINSKENMTDYYSACLSGEAVVFRGDGEPRLAATTLQNMQDLDPSFDDEDSYSVGGTVEKLEIKFADMLGKESAVFMPTGTLANHIAIRKLCGINQKAIVPEQSHLYNDSGDTVTRLSGINLVPLGRNLICFSIDELRDYVERMEQARVSTQIGAVMIESPVRRQQGQVVSFEQMEEITQFCSERGYGTHLDGARLYMMSGATGIPPRDYVAMFDTVYVSLYKYFGAPFGAILAGPSELLKDVYHERRMFGGSLSSSYIAAALALKESGSFEPKFKESMQRASDLIKALAKLPQISIKTFDNGSNIFLATLNKTIDVDAFVLSLQRRMIFVYKDDTNPFQINITINPTILRRSAEELLASFKQAFTEAS
ncbi:MAG: aminotransferase class I/II-fold pyridoxal phosphate-dependent enzyme [Chloroflexota bacterium]|nr:aminotransferase class I/II-fold pyridoxal phosphate-dependent enzyme [Chloroflexota bacterium]